MNRKTLSFLILIVLMMVVMMSVPTTAETTEPAESTVILLNMESAEVAKGKTIKLAVTAVGDFTPQKPVYKWQSSDKKIATVQSGTVTGVTAGKATITVTLKIDESLQLSASSEITVYAPVSSIATKDKTITLNVNSTFSPTVTITPKTATNQSLLWKSDNESIATVSDKGVIKAIKSGECSISAVTRDGSNKTVSIKIFVPTLSTSTKQVSLGYLNPTEVRIKYYSNKNRITVDDNNAKNNIFFDEFKDGVLVIRIWPWQTGTSTLTISDSTSPKSTIKIKIDTPNYVGINSRAAFPNINQYYKDYMRYGVGAYDEQCYYMKARVMQMNYESGSAWILAYSKGKYDDLVYMSFNNSEKDKHQWFKGENVRVQEGDEIYAWVKPTDIYSYETTSGATNYALQLKPIFMSFEDGAIFYMDKNLYN